MDDIVDDLVRNARRCERAYKTLVEGKIHELSVRIGDACDEVGLSWSGSHLGYHATVYLNGFRRPRGGEVFDHEWGGRGGFSSQTAGDWRVVEYDDVKEEVLRRAGGADLTLISDAVKEARETFEQAKEELLPTFDAILSVHADNVIGGLRDKLDKLESHISLREIALSDIPRGQVFTRDTIAGNQGFRAAHHGAFKAWLMEQLSYGVQANEIAKIARHAARYLEQKYKMKGKSIAKTDGKIFIGHGRSNAWNDLKDFIRDRLGLDYDEFNREPSAGLTVKERLVSMLDNACFAFLVMTAEDEHADGSKHARENVIHEIGLFQGRLGFERAIILLEEGCQEFSNIHGIQQIRFPTGNLKSVREDIRHVLERENIVKK